MTTKSIDTSGNFFEMRQELRQAFDRLPRESDGLRVNKAGAAYVKDGEQNFLRKDLTVRTDKYRQGLSLFKDKLNADLGNIVIDGMPIGTALVTRVLHNKNRNLVWPHKDNHNLGDAAAPLDRTLLGLADAELRQMLDEAAADPNRSPGEVAMIRHLSDLLQDSIENPTSKIAATRLNAWRRVTMDMNILAGSLEEEAADALVARYPHLADDPQRLRLAASNLGSQVLEDIGDLKNAGLCAESVNAAKHAMRARLADHGFSPDEARRAISLERCTRRMDARQKLSITKTEMAGTDKRLASFCLKKDGYPDFQNTVDDIKETRTASKELLVEFEKYLQNGQKAGIADDLGSAQEVYAKLIQHATALEQQHPNDRDALVAASQLRLQATRVYDLMTSVVHPDIRTDPFGSPLMPADPNVTQGRTRLYEFGPSYLGNPINVQGISLNPSEKVPLRLVDERMRNFNGVMTSYNRSLDRVQRALTGFQEDTPQAKSERVRAAIANGDPNLRAAALQPVEALGREIDVALKRNDYALRQLKLTTGRRDDREYEHGLEWSKNWFRKKDANPGNVERQLKRQRRELQAMKFELARVVARRASDLPDEALHSKDVEARRADIAFGRQEAMNAEMRDQIQASMPGIVGGALFGQQMPQIWPMAPVQVALPEAVEGQGDMGGNADAQSWIIDGDDEDATMENAGLASVIGDPEPFPDTAGAFGELGDMSDASSVSSDPEDKGTLQTLGGWAKQVASEPGALGHVPRPGVAQNPTDDDEEDDDIYAPPWIDGLETPNPDIDGARRPSTPGSVSSDDKVEEERETIGRAQEEAFSNPDALANTPGGLTPGDLAPDFLNDDGNETDDDMYKEPEGNDAATPKDEPADQK